MSKIKISADTSPIKKSLLDLSNEIKKVGKGNQKVSLISEGDKKFFKQELSRELSNIKKKIIDNRQEITKLVSEQRKLKTGSEDELKIRNKIIEAYRTQNRLAKESNNIQNSMDALGGGGIGGLLKGGLGKLGKFGKLGALGPLAALAGVGMWTYGKAREGMSMYEAANPNRLRLMGMGADPKSYMSASALASAGLTEQDLISRRVTGVSSLGTGYSSKVALQQAQFERAYGLESGSLLNSTIGLRSQFGAKGAIDVQNKMQAAIIATGLEEAIGPHLQAMTSLLASINDNGVTSSGDLIWGITQLAKTSGRTSEQLAASFGSVDSAIKGASGERAAFLQTAFARAGIGGGSIGGTRFAMEAGGLTGLSRSEMEKLGFNSDLLDKLQKQGIFDNTGARATSILNQFARSGRNTGTIDSINDPDSFFRMNNLANSIFGTSGVGGSMALKALSDYEAGEISKSEYESKLKDIQRGDNPVVDKLDAINTSLSGQTDVLMNIEKTLLMAFGENVEGAANLARRVRNLPLSALGYQASGQNIDDVTNTQVSDEVRKRVESWGAPSRNGIGEAIKAANPNSKIVINAFINGENVSESTYRK